MNLFVGYGKMLHAARNDEKFPLVHQRFVIAKTHAQRTLYDEKQLVFGIVMMPDELAFDLHGLYVTVIQFANNPRIPMVLKFAELFSDIYNLHVVLLKAEV
jgi:hypothetical protein